MSVSSLWTATAASSARHPRLEGDLQADIVVVGAGFTGLSAALHCARDGRFPVVLEAETVGHGASGRNGGLVSGKFRVPFHVVAAGHGREAARRLYEIGKEAVDCVEELVDRHGVTGAGFSKTGYITAAHTLRALEGQKTALEWLRTEVGDASSRLLTAGDVAEELGTSVYVGGSFNPAAGALHPLNYVRGLAEAAVRSGVGVYENSPVSRVASSPDGVVVETPGGTVRARQIIYATNGYSTATPATAALKTRVIPFRSAIIATAPLSDNLRRSVLPSGRVAADTKRLLRWYRIVDDRMVFGGRGSFGRDERQSAYDGLRDNMESIFPQLAGQPIAYSWSGLVAMTLDYLPHVGQLDARSFYAMGYNGSGVAMSSLMGRYLAAITRGDSPNLGLISSRRFAPIPFYPLQAPAVRAASAWYQLLDALGR
jgi:glycine/D-amino acid oxidase-like deaminating enzyme